MNASAINSFHKKSCLKCVTTYFLTDLEPNAGENENGDPFRMSDSSDSGTLSNEKV